MYKHIADNQQGEGKENIEGGSTKVQEVYMGEGSRSLPMESQKMNIDQGSRSLPIEVQVIEVEEELEPFSTKSQTMNVKKAQHRSL